MTEKKTEKPAEAAAPKKNSLEKRLSALEALVFPLVRKAEKVFGRDFNKDGLIGGARISLIVLLGLLVVLGTWAFSAETILTRYESKENRDAVIEIACDDEDDTNDELQIVFNTDNDLSFTIGGTERFNLTAAGVLSAITGFTLSGDIDCDSVTVNAGEGIDNQAAGTLMVGAATATKVEIGDSGVETEVQGDLDAQANIILQNAETIDNATDAEVRITADDDAALLLEVALESDNAATNMADNDLMSITMTANDSATNKQEYASLDLKATDVTTATEDSEVVVNYMAGGAAKSVTIGATSAGAERILPGADNAIDLGATGAEWKDVYVDGVAYLDAVSHGADEKLLGDTQVGAVATAGVASDANYIGAVHYDVITFTNVVETATDGSDEGESQVILAFPEGRILILGAAINAQNVMTTGCTNQYHVAIGSAAAGDDADLTSTEADIIAKNTIDVSGGVMTNQWEADMTSGADSVFDGTASAQSLYFNLALADTDMNANCTNTLTGSIGITWTWLGDD